MLAVFACNSGQSLTDNVVTIPRRGNTILLIGVLQSKNVGYMNKIKLQYEKYNFSHFKNSLHNRKTESTLQLNTPSGSVKDMSHDGSNANKKTAKEHN